MRIPTRACIPYGVTRRFGMGDSETGNYAVGFTDGLYSERSNPSYFEQSKRGRHDINDVCHAKILISGKSRKSLYPTSVIYSSRAGYLYLPYLRYFTRQTYGGKTYQYDPGRIVNEPLYGFDVSTRYSVQSISEGKYTYILGIYFNYVCLYSPKLTDDYFVGYWDARQRFVPLITQHGHDWDVYPQSGTYQDFLRRLALAFGAKIGGADFYSGRETEMNNPDNRIDLTRRVDSFFNSSLSEIQSWISLIQRKDQYYFNNNTWDKRYAWQVPSPVDLNLEQAFLLHEPDRVMTKVDLLYGQRDLTGYWFNVLVQQAYLSALDSVPKLNDNSISNLLEVIGFMKSLIIDHKVDIPKSLSSAWLAYRYQFQTTKLDIKEAIHFVHRHIDLGEWKKWLQFFGTSAIDAYGPEMTCRCSLYARPNSERINTILDVWDALYKWGLQPNFYVVWDMIPYSFIVDWFIPIGTIAHTWDVESQFQEGGRYEIDRICFSITYLQAINGVPVKCYSRWKQGTPPALLGYYTIEQGGPSNKVMGFRILDTLALIFG